MCPIDHHSSPPLSLFHPVPCRRSNEFGPNGIHYAFTDNLLNGAACRNPFIVTYSMVLGPPNGFFKGEILILDCHLRRPRKFPRACLPLPQCLDRQRSSGYRICRTN